MRRILIIPLLLLLIQPAFSAWEEPLKEVTIGEMGFSLMLPESWSVIPDEDGFKAFSTLDRKILCCPILIEDDATSISIFIYATARDDFQSTMMEMAGRNAERESDVVEIDKDISKSLFDADGNEYSSLRNMHLVNREDLAYGVVFHRDGVRFEIYYLPWNALEFGDHFGKYLDVLATINFAG